MCTLKCIFTSLVHSGSSHKFNSQQGMMIFIIGFFYEKIALRKMNLILQFLIISTAAKKTDYNHGLAITLSLVLNMPLLWLAYQSETNLQNQCKVIIGRWENLKKWCGKRPGTIGGIVKFLIMRRIQLFMNSLTVQGCSNL